MKSQKKSLKQQFCAHCGKPFSRYKLQSYCGHVCANLARGERGKRGLSVAQLAEWFVCVDDPRPCHGAGFRGIGRTVEGWLTARDGLTLENFKGEQVTTPDFETRRPAEPRTATKPETAELKFGERRGMRLTATKVG